MEACTTCINEEFRSEQAALGYDRPTDFLTSQWPVPERGYVIYRVVVALAITGWVLSDGAYEATTYYDGAVWKWFIFATNWSFLLLALSSIFQAITCCLYHWRQHWIIDPQFPRTMPLVLKLQWIILNMSYNSALVVTLSYWSFIAFFDHSALMLSDMSRLKHTMNTVYVLGDLMLSGSRIRILHMFFTVTLGSVYALFNAIYFLNDGTINSGERGVHNSHYAYSFMNWSKPVEAIITCVLCVIQAIVSQVLLALLTRLRVFIYRKAYGVEAEVRVESEMQNIVSESTSYSAIDDMEVKVDPK